MRSLAKKINVPIVQLEYGLIVAVTARAYIVETQGGETGAVTAASCLLKPVEGDRVLVSLDHLNQAYILAVLEKAKPEAPQEISLKGPVRLHVEAGDLSLSADTNLNLAARRGMNLAAEDFQLDAETGQVNVNKISLLSRFFQAQIQRVKYLAESVDAIFQRLVSRSRTSYRYVSEHDEHQTASTRLIVDGSLTMQTKTTLHTAEGHIKMDAEQIHLA